MRTHADYEAPRASQGGWGCVAWLLLGVAGVAISSVLVLFVGSLVAEFLSWRSPLVMLLCGVWAAFFPVLVLNSALTWLRQRWNPRAGFRSTFWHMVLLCNTSWLMLLVVFVPGPTSRSLKRHGHWPFGKESAAFFQLKEQHVVMRTGRRLVKRMAYLLELEGSNATTIVARTDVRQPPRELPAPQPSSAPVARPTLAPPPAARAGGNPLSRRLLQPLRTLFQGRNAARPDPPMVLPPRRAPVAGHRTPPAATPPAITPPAARTAKAGKTVKLRFKKMGNALIVPINLSGTKTKILLDTGASYLTLSRRMLDRLGIDLPMDAPRLVLQTANGKMNAPVGLLSWIKLGDVELRNVSFVLCNACADSKRSISGLLGLNVLRRFLFTLDHESGVIMLQSRPSRKNRSADMKPFLRYSNLQGRTTQILVRRVFSLRGTIKNHASLGVKNLRFRILYLRAGKGISSREFKMAPLAAGQQRNFSFKDPKAPRFGRYRMELMYGEWVDDAD